MESLDVLEMRKIGQLQGQHTHRPYNMYKNVMDITAINTIKVMRSRHEKCYSVASLGIGTGHPRVVPE